MRIRPIHILLLLFLSSCGAMEERVGDEKYRIAKFDSTSENNDVATMADSVSSAGTYTVTVTDANGCTTSDTLSMQLHEFTSEEHRLYRARSVQLLQDLLDYLELISNKKVDPEMRAAAAEQALLLFADSTTRLNISIPGMTGSGTMTASCLIAGVYNSTPDSMSLDLRKPMSVGELVPTKEGYEIITQLELGIHAWKNGKAGQRDISCQAVVLIRKEAKKFGNTTEDSWEPRLGGLK